jgi:hypothetical protein
VTASESDKSRLSSVEDYILAPLGALLSTGQERAELSRRAKAGWDEQCRRAKLLGELTVAYSLQTMKRSLWRESASESQAPDRDDVHVEPTPAAAPPVNDLIADYDSLSASQVVSLLESLGVGERERIRAYEASHRGRRTILGKIEALGRNEGS